MKMVANGCDQIKQLRKNSNDVKCSGVLYETDDYHVEPTNDEDYMRNEVPLEIIWKNVYIAVLFHLLSFYSYYRVLVQEDVVFRYICLVCIGVLFHLSITAGYHRLWTHKSYKATLPLRVLLAATGAGCGMGSIFEWARDHRVHHKYTETHADPHNAKRGFFFAHIGWLMCRKHPEVKNKGKLIDLSDLEADPVVVWQRNNYGILVLAFGVIIPMLFLTLVLSFPIPEAFYGTIAMYFQGLHSTFLVNSAAHLWGKKPYDKRINPSENLLVAILVVGEGWHNYHHTFPWDYKTSELGFYRYNLTTAYIDFFAWIGWAYDLKAVSPDVIRQRVLRTGDKLEWERNTK